VSTLIEISQRLMEFEVGLGLMKAVQRPSALSIAGIGSCVGLALRDGESRISGLAHVILPNSDGVDDARVSPGKYSDTAVRILTQRMTAMGADLTRFTAKLVGGARVLSKGSFDGWKNVQSARKELSRANIRVVAQDVGLSLGRSMRFDTASGDITIRRYQEINGVAELKDIIVI